MNMVALSFGSNRIILMSRVTSPWHWHSGSWRPRIRGQTDGVRSNLGLGYFDHFWRPLELNEYW